MTNRGFELTPVAVAAGRRLADRLFGGAPLIRLPYEDIPTVVFSHPVSPNSSSSCGSLLFSPRAPDSWRKSGHTACSPSRSLLYQVYSELGFSHVQPIASCGLTVVQAERRYGAENICVQVPSLQWTLHSLLPLCQNLSQAARCLPPRQ
eukprot:SAG11_NODE_116_length_16002_cov_19.164560_12_plen_149_part_00